MPLKLGVCRVIALAGAALCCVPWPASAQLSRLGSTINAIIPGGVMRGTDIAYDPVHGVYLIVVGNGPVFGVFVNVQGVPVTAPFTIMSSPGVWAHFPRAAYSPDVLGGQGGFLVTWHHNVDAKATIHCVFGRIVSYAVPGALAGGIQQISDGSQGGTWHETGPAMAYSRTSRRFFIAWRTSQYGIQGRLLDVNGAPIGGVLPIENPGGSREPTAAWNPATDEFGLMNTAFTPTGDFAAFRRVRAVDGTVSARTTFGFAPEALTTAIGVNSRRQYVVAWTQQPGTMSATFDQNGTLLATNLVSSRIGYDQSLGMSFNAATGTFLVVSNDMSSLEIAAVELRSDGTPITTSQIITDGAQIGSFYPMTTPRAQSNQWDVVYTRDFQGATNQVVQTATRDLPPRTAPRADFDGDGKADIAVFRPANGTWYIVNSSTTIPSAVQWGNSADVPVSGDYDGDGRIDIAVFRPSNGTWYIVNSSTGIPSGVPWGNGADIPVPGDYDGDGRTDIAVFRPSNGTWYIIQSATGTPTGTPWGNASDIPVPADYDGDGKTDLAVFRPATGTWYIVQSGTGTPVGVQWGNGNDIPVPGDYDGDGRTDVAVFRPSNGTWYVHYATGAVGGVSWGNSSDVPVPADYDGDGRTDIAVFRPANGTWYIIRSSSGVPLGVQWGNAADVPVVKR